MLQSAGPAVKRSLTALVAGRVAEPKYLFLNINDLYPERLPAGAPSRNLRGRGAAQGTGPASSSLDFAGCRRI